MKRWIIIVVASDDTFGRWVILILKVLIIINVGINLDILNQEDKLIDLESELLRNFLS